jgi:hypothetical protein
MLSSVDPLKTCPTRRRLTWSLLNVLVAFVLLLVAGWLAGLVVPVREGTFTGEAAEAVGRSMSRRWWVSLTIYAGMCALAFYIVPLARRRWRASWQGRGA